MQFGIASVSRKLIMPPEDVLAIDTPEGIASINFPDGSVKTLDRDALELAIRSFRRGEPLDGTIKVQLGTGSALGTDKWTTVVRGVEIRANLFISTSSKSGIKPHFDDHHVFAVQLEGRKHWELGGVVAVASPERESRYPEVDPKIRQRLFTDPGDILYMPPGEWHGASTPSQSVHLTVGLYVPTYADLLRQMVTERAQIDPLVRSQLALVPDGNGLFAPAAPTSEQLETLAPRISRLPLTTQQSIFDRGALMRQDEPSLHEARLEEVLSQFDVSLISSIYARGSGARREHEPWDVDFLVITQTNETANLLSTMVHHRGDGVPPLDIKVVSAQHLVTTPDGRAKRIQLASEARLMWGDDVLSMMAPTRVDDTLLDDMRDRCIRVAKANIDALVKGDAIDVRRVAKSLLRLGSPFASRSLQTVNRNPATCAAFLALEFPEVIDCVRVLLSALQGKVESDQVIASGRELLLRVAHGLVR
jgi:hypothetical protein